MNNQNMVCVCVGGHGGGNTTYNSMKKIEHSDISPPKHAWDLHAENCKRMLKSKQTPANEETNHVPDQRTGC